jgi:hypothetical protein
LPIISVHQCLPLLAGCGLSELPNRVKREARAWLKSSGLIATEAKTVPSIGAQSRLANQGTCVGARRDNKLFKSEDLVPEWEIRGKSAAKSISESPPETLTRK